MARATMTDGRVVILTRTYNEICRDKQNYLEGLPPRSDRKGYPKESVEFCMACEYRVLATVQYNCRELHRKLK